MQKVARTTDALPVLTVVENNASSMLLPHQLKLFISSHEEFMPGCASGYEVADDYADVSTRKRVRAFIVSEICRLHNWAEAAGGVSPLPFRAGFCLGFLSVLARTHRDVALWGVGFLSSLVLYEYREEIRRGCNPLVAVPALDEYSDECC